MNTEAVAPFQLHRDLERARVVGEEEERISILTTTLESGNLAVIRRIPELLLPLSDAEKMIVAQWAKDLTEDQEVSHRDFAFHLMVNCGVPKATILQILEQNKTFSRGALEHIQRSFQGEDAICQLDDYLHGVADHLLCQTRIPSRDRGRHMLITLARTETDDWQSLAVRFSQREISDLRQKVIERFLAECPEGAALEHFVDNVVKMCLDCIRQSVKEDVHKEATHMHWVITCLKRVNRSVELSQAVSLLQLKFGMALPSSVRLRIQDQFTVSRPRTPVSRGPHWHGESIAQIAERLGISKSEVRRRKQAGEVL